MANGVVSKTVRGLGEAVKTILQVAGFFALVLVLLWLPGPHFPDLGTFWSWIVSIAAWLLYWRLIEYIYKHGRKPSDSNQS